MRKHGLHWAGRLSVFRSTAKNPTSDVRGAEETVTKTMPIGEGGTQRAGEVVVDLVDHDNFTTERKKHDANHVC